MVLWLAFAVSGYLERSFITRSVAKSAYQTSAWNVPIIMFAAKAGSSLAAGNCMIIKTSEKSPLSGALIAELSAKAGFPPGVLQVLSGAGLTGRLLAEYVSSIRTCINCVGTPAK